MLHRTILPLDEGPTTRLTSVPEHLHPRCWAVDLPLVGRDPPATPPATPDGRTPTHHHRRGL